MTVEELVFRGVVLALVDARQLGEVNTELQCRQLATGHFPPCFSPQFSAILNTSLQFCSFLGMDVSPWASGGEPMACLPQWPVCIIESSERHAITALDSLIRCLRVILWHGLLGEAFLTTQTETAALGMFYRSGFLGFSLQPSYCQACVYFCSSFLSLTSISVLPPIYRT